MCQITEPTEHEIKLLLDNQQVLWDRLCLSTKNWHSPTDSLRCPCSYTLIFFIKTYNVRMMVKGRDKHDMENTSSSLLKCTLFGHGCHTTLSVHRMVQSTILPPSHSSWLLSSLLLILSSRLPSHAASQPKWPSLVYMWDYRHHPETTFCCHIPNLSIAAVRSVSGVAGSGNSASVWPWAFISVMPQQFNHSTISNMILEMTQQKSIFICPSHYKSQLPAS